MHVRNDYKKQKTKQTNLGCAFVFLFMHECITAYPCLCWSKVKQLYFGSNVHSGRSKELFAVSLYEIRLISGEEDQRSWHF